MTFLPKDQQTSSAESPPRYSSRLQDRYSELESPIRTTTTTTSSSTGGLKNSPLQPNRSSLYKFNETDKYASFEIKNEDRGSWRETNTSASAATSLKTDVVQDEEAVVQQVEIKKSPSSNQQQSAPVTTTHTSSKASDTTVRPPSRIAGVASHRATVVSQRPTTTTPTQPPLEQQQRATSSQERYVPHYMKATTSFDRKAKAAREEHRHSIENPLRARSHGGITKRVGTTRVPRYQSTTSINAIHEIQNEMAPDDVYIPMAARIKMFERGLGNASNPSKPPTASSSSSSRRSTSRSSRNKITVSSSQQSQPRRSDSPSIASSSVPNYARKTVSSEQKVLESGSSTSSTNTDTTSTTHKNRLGMKPFHFVTHSERAAEEASSSFQEKLNLWKKKDKIATIHSYNHSSKKRKADQITLPTNNNNNKHTRYI